MSTCLIRYTPVRLLELRKFSHVVALKKEPRVAGRATDAAGPVFPIDASAGKIRPRHHLRATLHRRHGALQGWLKLKNQDLPDYSNDPFIFFSPDMRAKVLNKF